MIVQRVYGPVRYEVTRTLQKSIQVGVEGQRGTDKEGKLEDLVDKHRLMDLMDLPLIALSNGQKRRARNMRAILNAQRLVTCFTQLRHRPCQICQCVLFQSHPTAIP